MEPVLSKFGDLTAEAQAARLLRYRQRGLTSLRAVAAEMGLPVERAQLLICRGLSTLVHETRLTHIQRGQISVMAKSRDARAPPSRLFVFGRLC